MRLQWISLWHKITTKLTSSALSVGQYIQVHLHTYAERFASIGAVSNSLNIFAEQEASK